MYERFSPSARRAMQLSNQSCQRFDHYFKPGAILPLHVLDGILQTPWGGASDIFSHLVGDSSIVRDRVIKLLQEIPGEPGALMGKIRQSSDTKQAIESAIQEAEYRKSSYVGTEHLLIGIIRLNDTEPASSLLRTWFDVAGLCDHLWVINYNSTPPEKSWKEYREWYQWSSHSISDNCLKAALAIAPDWKANFGCRVDDAIHLLDSALDHPACPEVLTVDWLTRFVLSKGT